MMIRQRCTFRSVLVPGLLSLSLMAGCGQEGDENPGGGVGGTGTVPDRSRGVTPSPVTPGPGDMGTKTGTKPLSPHPESGADATTRTGTHSDVHPGTGSSVGTGSSPSEPTGATPAPRSDQGTGSTGAKAPAAPAAGSDADHNETRSGSAGNSGTTSGSGTGNGTSGGTTSKGPGPQQ